MDMPMNSTGMMDMGNSTMDMDHSNMDHNNMMPMYFYFGVTNVHILFASWMINSVGGMVGACFGVFFLAMIYEGLKVLRETLIRKNNVKMRVKSQHTDYQNGLPLMDASTTLSQKPLKSTMWTRWHLLQTLLHLVQVTISYALMLIFMSYNGYLAIAIVVGAGVGYFVFGWKKAVIVDINEHCH